MPRSWPYLNIASLTCTASSRVGTTTNAVGTAGAFAPMAWRIGSANAAVLPGACRSLTQHVGTREQERDRFTLDRRRFLVSESGQRSEELLGQPERGEAVLVVGYVVTGRHPFIVTVLPSGNQSSWADDAGCRPSDSPGNRGSPAGYTRRTGTPRPMGAAVPTGLPRALTDFLATAPDAMLLIDASGEIVATNPRADALFGDGEQSLVGHSVDELVHAGWPRSTPTIAGDSPRIRCPA